SSAAAIPVPKNAIDTAVAPTVVVAYVPNFFTCDLRVTNLWLCFTGTECLVHRTLESPAGRTLGGTVALAANHGRRLTAPWELDLIVCIATRRAPDNAGNVTWFTR